MVSEKTWLAINISLFLVGFLLVLNLFGVSFPSFGQSISFFDDSSPACAVEWKDEINLWNDIDRCCLEVRSQLECEKENKEVDQVKFNRVCTTGNENVLKYWINNKAYNYCKKQPIWS